MASLKKKATWVEDSSPWVSGSETLNAQQRQDAGQDHAQISGASNNPGGADETAVSGQMMVIMPDSADGGSGGDAATDNAATDDVVPNDADNLVAAGEDASAAGSMETQGVAATQSSARAVCTMRIHAPEVVLEGSAGGEGTDSDPDAAVATDTTDGALSVSSGADLALSADGICASDTLGDTDQDAAQTGLASGDFMVTDFAVEMDAAGDVSQHPTETVPWLQASVDLIV
jgi:hypothetical protein